MKMLARRLDNEDLFPFNSVVETDLLLDDLIIVKFQSEYISQRQVKEVEDSHPKGYDLVWILHHEVEELADFTTKPTFVWTEREMKTFDRTNDFTIAYSGHVQRANGRKVRSKGEYWKMLNFFTWLINNFDGCIAREWPSEEKSIPIDKGFEKAVLKLGKEEPIDERIIERRIKKRDAKRFNKKISDRRNILNKVKKSKGRNVLFLKKIKIKEKNLNHDNKKLFNKTVIERRIKFIKKKIREFEEGKLKAFEFLGFELGEEREKALIKIRNSLVVGEELNSAEEIYRYLEQRCITLREKLDEEVKYESWYS